MPSKTNKVNKISRSFRPDPEVLEDLSGLADRWEIPQARVLEFLVREAVAEDKMLKQEIVAQRGDSR